MQSLTDDGSGLGNVPLPSDSDVEYWDSFSWGDLKAVLVGDHSRDLVGYYERKRALDLTKLGFEFPVDSVPFDDASQFLADFNQARIDHYSGLEFLTYDSLNGAYKRHKLLCRGTPGYQAKQGDFFDDLLKYVTAGKVPMVHLRISPRVFDGESPLDSFLFMDGIVNKFLSWLQVQIKYRPHYVWVAEPTKKGHKHLHFIFFGTDFLVSKELLDSWWQRQGLGDKSGIWIERVDNPRKMLGYLVKYLLKTVGSDGPQRWQGLLALTRRRQYGVSNSLRRAVAKNLPLFEVQEVAEEYNQSLKGKRFTSIGVNNSNSFFSLGIHDRSILAALFYPFDGGLPPPSVLPPPDEMRARLSELYVVAKSFNSLSRFGRYLTAEQIVLRDRVNRAFVPDTPYHQRQFERVKLLLDEGLSLDEIKRMYPDLNFDSQPALSFLLDKFLNLREVSG